MIRLRTFLLSCLLAFSLSVAAEHQPRPFGAGSLNEILEAHAGKAFILMFWSLDCASCMHDLDLLSAEAKKHPDMKLVMVATDEADFGDRVADMLAKHDLVRAESWIFANPNKQRLRYEVDNTWYGELPRSYFYDAEHQRVALSGAVTAAHIEAWRSAVAH